MKKYIIEPEYDGYEIGTYLKETKGYSGRGLRNLEIYLNGKRVKNNSKKVRKLNRLHIREKEKETGIKPMDIPIKIAYEDKNLLLINKDPYIIVHPTQKKVDKTLANGVVNYFLKTTGKVMVPRFYNRLDMNTSGIIIVTKNAYAQSYLQEKGIVNKFYQAIVLGIVEKDEFELGERALLNLGHTYGHSLEKLFNLRRMQSHLDYIQVNKDIAGRYYQEAAIKAVCDAFDKRNRRKIQ